MSVFLFRCKDRKSLFWTTFIHLDLFASGWTKKYVHNHLQPKTRSSGFWYSFSECISLNTFFHTYFLKLSFYLRRFAPFGTICIIKKNNKKSATFIFTKSCAPRWVFLTFFKFCKWYQIAQILLFLHCLMWLSGKRVK